MHGVLFRSAHRKSQLLHWQILEDGWNVWGIGCYSRAFYSKAMESPATWNVCQESKTHPSLHCSIGPIIGRYWKSWKTVAQVLKIQNAKTTDFHVTLQNAPKDPSSQPAARSVPSQSWAHTLPRHPGTASDESMFHSTQWWENPIISPDWNLRNWDANFIADVYWHLHMLGSPYVDISNMLELFLWILWDLGPSKISDGCFLPARCLASPVWLAFDFTKQKKIQHQQRLH